MTRMLVVNRSLVGRSSLFLLALRSTDSPINTNATPACQIGQTKNNLYFLDDVSKLAVGYCLDLLRQLLRLSQGKLLHREHLVARIDKGRVVGFRRSSVESHFV
jgi:hypothetical protein